MTALKVTPMKELIRIHEVSGCRLWIDQVGVFLVWFPNELTIGNAFPSQQPKLSMMADLRTKHVSFIRKGDEYQVEPYGPVSIQQNAVTNPSPLRTDTTLLLGDDVEVGFHIPTPLSSSATIDFQSDHQPVNRLDRVIMFHQTCILGRGQSHIECPQWKTPVILFERDNTLWLKTNQEFQIDGESQSSPVPLNDQSTVTGTDSEWRCHFEIISKMP